MIPADARHMRRMLECISGVRRQSVSLVQGASTLLFLLNAMEDVEEGWADEFTSYLVTLDSAGTASLNQIATMGSRYVDVVHDTLDTLERLVRDRLPPEEENMEP